MNKKLQKLNISNSKPSQEFNEYIIKKINELIEVLNKFK